MTRRGGQARGRYWYTQNFVNLERATIARWTMRQRPWPEEPYSHEYIADLSGQQFTATPLATRTRTRVRKSSWSYPFG
jgi:hypothetical protein